MVVVLQLMLQSCSASVLKSERGWDAKVVCSLKHTQRRFVAREAGSQVPIGYATSKYAAIAMARQMALD